MRPALRLLEGALVESIIGEAFALLAQLGVEVHNPPLVSLLADHGARLGADGRIRLPENLVERCLASVPRAFRLYDVLGNLTHEFTGENVYFTPGSAAIHILDARTGQMRKPVTADYVRYAKLVSRLEHLASQSTALIPADVPAAISDSYRLYLSLLYSEKPVVTGAFTIESFRVMHEMQVIVRGDEGELRRKPLTVFSCCPTAPLKWSDVTSQNLVDCARAGIPVELVSMPLSGFVAPVTLVGSLIQQTAENLSGVVISQTVAPGHPLLFGGSPAVFDVRYETTPMGAIETAMLNCAASQIGKRLGMPTQGYVGLSDAKQLDPQAGLETGMGALLATLAGINSVSGPGMLNFESCQSLEKLVLDNEICGMCYRLTRGVEPREDFPSLRLFEELLREKHLLIADHTRRYLRDEITFPGRVIDRANRERWAKAGSPSLLDRAVREVERLIGECPPSRLAQERKTELRMRMQAEARRHGMPELPPLED